MIWIPVVAAIGGALAGATGPVIIAWMNARRERERLLLKCATDAALKDFEISTAQAANGKVFPMSTYLYYHIKFLELAVSGSLSEDAIKRLLKQRERILDIYETVPSKKHGFMQDVGEGNA